MNINVTNVDSVAFHLKNSDTQGDVALFSRTEAPYALDLANTAFNPTDLP